MTISSSRGASRLRLYVPLALALLLLGGYTALWFQGARVMRGEIDRWIAAERAGGREVAHGTIRVRGYPGSLRGVVDAPRWAEPDAWSWQAETLLVIAQPTRPRTLLLAPRGPQRVVRNGRTWDVEAADLRLALSRDSVAVQAEDLITSSGTERVTVGELRANWTRNEDGSEVLGIAARDGAADFAGEPVIVPRLDAALAANPGRRLALEAMQGALGTKEVTAPAELAAEGRVELTDDGYLEGRADLRLRGGGELIAVLTQQGLIPPEHADLAAGLIRNAEAQGRAVELPLSFRNAQVLVGPIPVAAQPRIGF